MNTVNTSLIYSYSTLRVPIGHSPKSEVLRQREGHGMQQLYTMTSSTLPEVLQGQRPTRSTRYAISTSRRGLGLALGGLLDGLIIQLGFGEVESGCSEDLDPTWNGLGISGG